MMRKFSRNYSLSVVLPFVAVLIALVALAALGQMPAAGQRSAQQAIVPARQGTSAPAQAVLGALLSPPTSAERAAASRLHRSQLYAGPMDGSSLLFYLAGTYSSDGNGATSVAVADVNGDGYLDLVIATRSSRGEVSVLLGNGDGTFRPAMTYASGGLQPDSVVIADVNGDGKLDLVVANSCQTHCGGDGSVAVLLGNGDGTFQSAVTYDSGGLLPGSVVVADVNGDGKPDLVVGNYTGVVVLLGNGDGTFQAAVSYETGGTFGWSVAVADLNNDGIPDIVATNFFPSSVSVLLGNGDGTFQPGCFTPQAGITPIQWQWRR